jgi:hypothetical protein
LAQQCVQGHGGAGFLGHDWGLHRGAPFGLGFGFLKLLLG